MNQIIVVGNLGKTTELRDTEKTKLALNSLGHWRSGGKKGDQTDWYNLIAFGRVAERLNEYPKGAKVLIVGTLQLEEYTAKDMTKKLSPKIVVSSIVPVGKHLSTAPEAALPPVPTGDSSPEMDEIPF